jgi:hypothetical protein
MSRKRKPLPVPFTAKKERERNTFTYSEKPVEDGGSSFLNFLIRRFSFFPLREVPDLASSILHTFIPGA